MASGGGPANQEMKRLMLEHAFKTVDHVVFLVGPDNRRSQRALKKLGARHVGERHTQDRDINLLFEMAPADLG